MTFMLILFVVGVCEILLYVLVFPKLGTAFLEKDTSSPSRVTATDVAKGMFERLVLSFALILDFPHILTLFGALKLGTRLKNKSETAAFNDFYLLGNLISVCVSMIYFAVWKNRFVIVMWIQGTQM